MTQAFEIWYFCGGRVGGMDISAVLLNFHSHPCIIVENIQAQYFDTLILSSGKKLYASVLNNGDKVMHQVCRYKYIPCL